VSPESRALSVFWNHKRFWTLQIVGIAMWLALAIAWFWLPDSRAWGVALSLLHGIVVIAGGLWLIGTALLFYRRAHGGEEAQLGALGRESLRRIPGLFVWSAALAGAVWVSLRPKAPGWIWMLPLILLLPLAAQVSAEGARGFFRMPWRLRYFPLASVLIAAGACLPLKLIAWHPRPAGLTLQTVSLTARFALAYLLAVSAWLALASLLARLSPDRPPEPTARGGPAA
jgi:hypothetical protein